MKLHILFVCCVLLCSVNGQRRNVKNGNTEVESGQRTGRGRARFTSTSDVQSSTEDVSLKSRETPVLNRRTNVRRRPESVVSTTSTQRTLDQQPYEVEEFIDEIPQENYKKFPRIVTESRFEAKDAATSKSLLQPNPSLNIQEIVNNFDKTNQEQALKIDGHHDLQNLKSTTELHEISSEIPRIKNEFDQSSTTQKPVDNRRELSRRLGRPRSNSAPKAVEVTTQSVRSRSRARPTKRPTDEAQASNTIPRTVNRNARRRPEAPRTLITEESREIPSRARSSRRESSAPKPIESRRNTDNPRSSREILRNRSRSREIVPPIIDEQKLEVLPLFERESNAVPKRSRLRNLNQDDHVASATENKINAIKQFELNEVEKNYPTSTSVVTAPTVRIKNIRTKKPIVKETVVAQVTEVTSRRTVFKKRINDNLRNLPKNKAPKIQESKTQSVSISRGRKKSEPGDGKKKTVEEVHEDDNYPEHFKALLQAKKQTGKETENELLPKTSIQVNRTRNRFLPNKKPSTTTEKTTTTTTERNKSRVKEHKFHARFNSAISKSEPAEINVPIKIKSFSPKPPRGLYSSKSLKESRTTTTNKLQPLPTQTPVNPPIPKKTNRFSSRYRNENARGSTIRTSTNAPVYLPTVPSVTSSTQEIYGKESIISGMEVISFDDPVNTANLVNGEYLASSRDIIPNSLVAESQIKEQSTEKPISIIERIINSIAAISTTESPDSSQNSSSSTTQENISTEQSAILKLATKKITTTKTDKTLQTYDQNNLPYTVTSEKPTTVIQKIISSLSAIQAETTTDSKSLITSKVGTIDFNTISLPSTTPMSKVSSSSTVLPAQISTSINPLSFDRFLDENDLQKRTIGKLLELLNSLTTQKPDRTVVVTPKVASFISTGSTSTQPTITTQDTTTRLYTSPVPFSISLNSRILENSPTTTQQSTSSTPTTTTVRLTQTPTTVGTPTTSTTESTTTTTLSNEIITSTIEPIASTSTTTTEVPITSTTESSTSIGTTQTETESNTNTETFYTVPPTLPTLINFEVSPGSVSVFSPNDLLSTSDDFATVTISSRNNFPDTTISNEILSTIGTTVQSNTVATNNDSPTTTSVPTTIESSTVPSSTTESDTTITSAPTTVAPIITTVTSSTPTSTTQTSVSENLLSTITPLTISDSTTLVSSTSISSQNSTESVSSNTTLTSISVPTNDTSPNLSARFSNRSGRLLDVIIDQEQNSNSIEATSPMPKDRDYFIFAVLNNNTILRKRPSRFPNKEAPYIIVGLYPNNTLVKKFPNGTIVPMEPIIRVSGFDTRENPPPLPEITSNQVTPDQGSQPDNTLRQTDDNASTSKPAIEPNPLSLDNDINNTSITTTTSSSNVDNSTTVESTTTTPAETTTPIVTTIISSSPITTTTSTTTITSTTTTQMQETTIPKLNELLNGKTVQAFNNLINQTEKIQTLEVDLKTNQVINIDDLLKQNNVVYRWKPIRTNSLLQNETSSTGPPSNLLANRMLEDTSTSTQPTTTIRNTVSPLTQPATTTHRSTTFFPTFLNNIISTFQTRRTTTTLPPQTEPPTTLPPTTITTPPPTTTSTLPPTTTITSTTTEVPLTTTPLDLAAMFSTLSPNTIPLELSLRNSLFGLTSTVPPTTEPPANKLTTLKKLTAQQEKDIATLAELEREQASILRQLAFLTSFNTLDSKSSGDKNSLANKIIALAMQREGAKIQTAIPSTTPSTTTSSSTTSATTTTSTTTTTTTTASNLLQDFLSSEGSHPAEQITTKDGKSPSLEELVRQLNLNGLNVAKPSTLTSRYGNTNEAIIAALLKEQGIGPTTPKALADAVLFTEAPPKATTKAPRPLMQSLNWLLNTLTPGQQREGKSKKIEAEEVLASQPTNVTPVVTAAPPNSITNSLSQTDIQKLIKQLEAIQKNPNAKQTLDLSSVTRLANEQIKASSAAPLLLVPKDVEIITSTTTAKPKLSLPPVQLKPIPGLNEQEPLVRGQLITAAVNVTKAISSFLGSALQDAAHQFMKMFGNGSSTLRSFLSSSSLSPNVASARGAATSFQSLLGSGSRMVQGSSSLSRRRGS